MNDTPNEIKETERPTVQMILKDWVDTEDLQNVMDYAPIDLFSIACIRLAADGDADDYQYWIGVEYVYKSEHANYQAELKDSQGRVDLLADSSWVEYIQYEKTALEVLKAALDEWHQEAFGGPYEEDPQ